MDVECKTALSGLDDLIIAQVDTCPDPVTNSDSEAVSWSLISRTVTEVSAAARISGTISQSLFPPEKKNSQN